MTFIPTISARLGRSTAAVIAAAAFAVLGGCQNESNTTTPADNGGKMASGQPMSQPSGDGTKFDTVRAFPTGDKASSVLLVEAMGPKTVRLNHDTSCDVKVTNLTDLEVKNVMLTSTSPDGFKMSGMTGGTGQPMAADNGKMGVAVGDLGPKESKTVTITGTATKATSIDTCYSVSYNPPTLCTHIDVTNPAIQLAVVAPPDSDICKPVTYKYTVTNTGTGTAHNVMVEEQLPDGLMTADGKQMVSATIGDLAQGESKSTSVDLKASKTGAMPGQATAKSDGDAAPAVATATAFHAPMLTVGVTGPASDYVNHKVAYTVTVTNKGDATAANTKVLIGRSGTGDGVVSADNIDANGVVAVGDLAPGQSKTLSANAMSAAGGTVTVAAEATADCAAKVDATAQTMFNTIPALLLETVDEADPVTVGQNVIYDVKVTNQGSGPDNNVAVKAMIPDGETYVSTEGPTQPTVDGQTLTFPVIATLATKESTTWKVSVKAARAGDVQFKTTASCDGTAPAEKTEPTKLVAQ